jgi:hypothetical protein
MPLLQMVAYVVVLNQVAGPLDCTLVGPAEVGCSNKTVVRLLDDGRLLFDNGITFGARGPMELAYSNGVTGHMDGFGWLEFSNGMGLREQADGSLKFTNELVCRAAGPDKASCGMGTPTVRDGCGFDIFKTACGIGN